eukprot:3904897-Amphidinium_carterae.1
MRRVPKVSQGRRWNYSNAPIVPIKGALARRTAISLRTNVCDRTVASSSRTVPSTCDQCFRLDSPHKRLSAKSRMSRCRKVKAPADKFPREPSKEKGRKDSPEGKIDPFPVAP